MPRSVSTASLLDQLRGWLNRPAPASPSPGSRAVFLRYALPPLLAWSAWLVLLFPGLLSSDSLDQWQQALHGPLYDHHPVFHTLLIRLLQQLWPSPALVAAVQVLTLALLVGWGSASLRAAGTSVGAAWAGPVLAALSPALGWMSITVWKDVAFTATVLALVILLFRAAAGLADLHRWGWWTGLCLCSVGALLLRHNGQPAVLGAFATVLWLHRRRPWRPLLLLGLTVAVAMGTRLGLNAATGTRPPPTMIALLGHTAAHVAHATPLAPHERNLLEQVRPLEDGWRYVCWTSDPTLFDGRINAQALREHDRALVLLTLRLALRSPITTLKHLKCSSELLWRIHSGAAPLVTLAITPAPGGGLSTINSEPGDPVTAYPWPGPAQWVLKAAVRSARPDWSWLFWRPALSLHALLLAAVLASVRLRAPWPLLVLAPLLTHTLGMALVMVSQEARYLMPTLLSAVVFVPGLAGLRRPASAS